MYRVRQIVHTPEDTLIPNWLVSIGFVRGVILLLVEVLMLKSMGMCNMGMMARDEVMALVGSIGVAVLEQLEEELGIGDGMIWEK